MIKKKTRSLCRDVVDVADLAVDKVVREDDLHSSEVVDAGGREARNAEAADPYMKM